MKVSLVIGTSSAIHTHANAQLTVYVRRIFWLTHIHWQPHSHCHHPQSHLIAMRRAARTLFICPHQNKSKQFLACKIVTYRVSVRIPSRTQIDVCERRKLLLGQSDISQSVKRREEKWTQSGIHALTHSPLTCHKVRHQYVLKLLSTFHVDASVRCERVCVRAVYVIRHYFFSSPLRCFKETFWNRTECVRPYTVCAEWNPFYCLVERTACNKKKKTHILFSPLSTKNPTIFLLQKWFLQSERAMQMDRGTM